VPDAHDPPSDAQRFIDALNSLDHVPTWHEAAALGIRLVDLSREEVAIRSALTDLEQTDQDFDAIVDPQLADALEADIADHRARLGQIEARPGRFFLATGEVIQRDGMDDGAYQSGSWFDDRSTLITTPSGARVHRPGIDPTASIDPTAEVHADARVEAGATVGPRVRIGPYAHVGRDAAVGEHAIIRQGAWVGPGSEVWSRSWIGEGATVEPHCVIGHPSSVGAGGRVKQGTEIEPYSRLGAGTTTSTTPRQPRHRSAQLANAIENVMHLDRE
jgi:carbonic anhydrase/acetyltransferase-like protein (isoleucine patch superfamily)